MATVNQQAERVLRLLLGMRLPAVQRALSPYGFSQEVVDDGWARLRALSPPVSEALDQPAAAEERVRPGSPALLKAVAQYRSRWFAVAWGALREAPQQSDLLFYELPQAPGVQSILALNVFLDRLEAMQAGGPPFGPEGPGARALLAERGLSPEVQQRGRALLDRYREIAPDRSDASVHDAREEQALQNLWSWYLQWSAICRTAVKNKVHLRALGFGRSASRTAEKTMSG